MAFFPQESSNKSQICVVRKRVCACKGVGGTCVCSCRMSTVGVEISTERHRLIDKVLVGINYIVLTRLKKGKKNLHI